MSHIKEQRIAQIKNITIWNILAILVVIAGIPMTIIQGRAVLKNWAQSGKGFPIGVWGIVDLKEMDILVYYESDDAIPSEYVTLIVMDLNDNLISVSTPSDRNDFSYKDKQGAALFVLSLPQSGSYRFVCNDAMASSISDNPQQDEIVFAKSPNSKAQAINKSNLTFVIGGASTLGLAAILYFIHRIWLHRKERPAKTPTPATFAANIGIPEE